MATLFISDLHLTEQRPNIVKLFIEFLGDRAKTADALYILGDLFEFWIGDEFAQLPQVQPVISALKQLTSGGVPVYVMHGNRDFLLDREFESLTGCNIIGDPAKVNLYGTEILLMHGDSLCTDDVDYIRFRDMIRDPDWRQIFLQKSVEERLAMAREYREMSKAAMAEKKPEIMDVNQGAVETEMRAHNVNILIHGHTHRPAIHRFTLGGGEEASRIVLGDWYEQGSVLVYDEQGPVLESLIG